MKKVFISYRRHDARYQARMIYDAFQRALPREHLFMDIDSIPPGADFVEILEREVGECEIMLALIGSGWIGATDPKTGRRRLDNQNDFVRIEIRAALRRGIPVVPVLLDDAQMPEEGDLPNDLKKLVRRQAEFVQFRTFDADVARLMRRLEVASEAIDADARRRGAEAKRQAEEQRLRAEGRIPVLVGDRERNRTQWILPGSGEPFCDIEGGPEMVVVPAGSFMMGSPETEPERYQDESPLHKVTVASPFAVGRHAVTRRQFAAFVNATGHKAEGVYKWTGSDVKHDPKASWRDPGFPQNDGHPITCVNWEDAKAYISWLAGVTGKPYRLLTEAEWEYAARAGTVTPFWWGLSISPAQANYNGDFVYAGGGSKGEYRKGTGPVGDFAANPWGLYNIHGNVWEWCEDIWHDSYVGAPPDASAWLPGGNSSSRVVRGGAWLDFPRYLRSACRVRLLTEFRDNYCGFRLGRTLTS
jgi:formylglycine-generating enzyme required for sulfatase activity